MQSEPLNCVPRFEIKNGKVSYQCRFIESNSWRQNRSAQRIVVSSYGTQTVPDPCHTIFQRISSLFVDEPINDNCNISIYPIGDEFYAFTECPIIHRLVKNSDFFDFLLIHSNYAN